MEIIKAYVRNSHTAEIVCPHCQGLTKISIEDLQKKYRSRISCSCQNDFVAEVDFRDKYRKPVDLPGHYCIASQKSESSYPARDDSHNCQVIDLSRNGIGILVIGDHHVKEGDILQLDFKLDDPASTDISQECEVRHVKDAYAGCKILNDTDALELYLLEQSRN